jgi:hypothetical protein
VSEHEVAAGAAAADMVIALAGTGLGLTKADFVL